MSGHKGHSLTDRLARRSLSLVPDAAWYEPIPEDFVGRR
jgi:hypothetical protein